MKMGQVSICPHFCLEILPSKFLPCKLTLWGEEVKMLASFYLHPKVYLDFYRHFTLKNHQFLPRSWGKIKNADHFFKSNNNSVKFFSQKRFTRAFVLLFATYPNLAATAATRPLKRKKKRQDFSCRQAGSAITFPENRKVSAVRSSPPEYFS